MKLTSTDFEDGGQIPVKFTCAGEGIRPNLSWSEIPDGAKSLAITLIDPDAPGGDFIHWLVINIPAATISIASDEVVGEEIPNSAGKSEYIPPCPPSGKHRYIFTLFALDADCLAASSFESFTQTAEPHIIDKAVLTGLYQKI
ncbi:MAG: YbhB/YbcL family Raf kinase inhibitor-like protein [Candidatus Berkelbacteria bacterium]|nr:YbhB/YbcL family Raf kinase inhibitor-like protein [Candidatus Berkelbacteria bacterium]